MAPCWNHKGEKYLILLLLCILTGSGSWAQAPSATPGPDTARIIEMPQVVVTAYQDDRLFRHVPGAVSILRSTELKRLQSLTGHEALRTLPGLNLVDEEGAGLRINVGVRGLDPDRSRNVLMLEDGIPVALNPYGEPEMYFTPVIDKMKAVEVLKGSGQLLFGPQTIGGVVNFVTADPPALPSTTVRVRGGSNGFFSGHVAHGETIGQFGYIVSLTHKQADRMGPTHFRLDDVSVKLKWAAGRRSEIGVKLGYYDETSNSTYVGITQAMYDAGGQDYVVLAPDDRLPVKRYNISTTYRLALNKAWRWSTTGFAYAISRNWRRQEFGRTASTADRTGIVWGDTTVAGGALYMRDLAAWRNRQFAVAGIETQLEGRFHALKAAHKVKAGARFLLEQAEEQFIQSTSADGFGGIYRDDEVRQGDAVSVYAVDEIRWSDRWSLNVGVRTEFFDYERHIRRGRFAINGVTQVRDTSLISGNQTFAVLPGMGMNYTVGEHLSVFAGVHRGFAPPRTKDAITSTGFAYDLDQESSWNYEFGARWHIGRLQVAPTAFLLDFQNQIIPTSQSSGSLNATGLTNGGRTRHLGLEVEACFDLLDKTIDGRMLQMGANATWVRSEYAGDRYIPVGDSTVNIKGNALPYAPPLMANVFLIFQWPAGPGLRLAGNYTGRQFADELNTAQPTADGLIGEIPARTVVDISVWHTWKKPSLTLSFSVKNLGNQRYIASRRPQGIKVGLPRFLTAGVDWRF